MLGALVLLGVLGRLEADHLHIACRAQVRDHAVTVEVHGHRLGVDLAVAVEVNRLVGGLALVQEASRAGTEAARLVQLRLVEHAVFGGGVAEVAATVSHGHAGEGVLVVHDAVVVGLVVDFVPAAVAQCEVVAELVHEHCHADVAACLAPEGRADGDHKVTTAKVSDTGGVAVVVVVAPDHVVEGAFAGGVELTFGCLDSVERLEFAVECLVADFVSAAQVVLGAAGATGVQVDVHAGSAVGVAQGQVGINLGDAVQFVFAGQQTCHVVHLNEDVLVVGVCAHCGEVDVDFAVAVSVVALHFPGVGDAVAVNIGAVGVCCGGCDSAQAEHCEGGKRDACALHKCHVVFLQCVVTGGVSVEFSGRAFSTVSMMLPFHVLGELGAAMFIH